MILDEVIAEMRQLKADINSDKLTVAKATVVVAASKVQVESIRTLLKIDALGGEGKRARAA